MKNFIGLIRDHRERIEKIRAIEKVQENGCKSEDKDSEK